MSTEEKLESLERFAATLQTEALELRSKLKASQDSHLDTLAKFEIELGKRRAAYDDRDRIVKERDTYRSFMRTAERERDELRERLRIAQNTKFKTFLLAAIGGAIGACIYQIVTLA